MLRIHRVFASSLAVVLIAGALSPVANAWPLGKAHLHPASNDAQAVLVAVQFHNKGESTQAVKVDGTVYSISAAQSVTIKAAAGTQVYAETAGQGYNKGDVLYVVRGDLKGATVSFN
jgi:uncharacterized protein with LGFP repeats